MVPDPSTSRAGVLVAGATARARDALLPALYCLAGELALVGLWDDDADRRQAARTWSCCPLVGCLAECDWERVDLVAVTVPPPELPAVLQALGQCPVAGKTLLLDERALAQQNLHCSREFEKFAAVRVLQAGPELPNLRVARDLVATGKIGKPQKLWLQHNGRPESAIAIARAFAGRAPVGAARVETFGPSSSGSGWREYALQFAGGFRASILEPCDFEMGRFALVGTEGAIVDYPLAAPNTLQIGCAFDGEFFRGITVNGDLQPLGPRDWEFCDRLPYARLGDDSLQALLVVRGLMEALHCASTSASAGGQGDSWHESLYNLVLLAALERFSVWRDPLAAMAEAQRASLLGFVLPAVARWL